jgi:putative transposase
VAKRFYLSLKMERIWQRQYANHVDANDNTTGYIVGFYHCKRINSAPGKLSRAVCEWRMATHEPIVVSEITSLM